MTFVDDGSGSVEGINVVRVEWTKTAIWNPQTQTPGNSFLMLYVHLSWYISQQFPGLGMSRDFDGTNGGSLEPQKGQAKMRSTSIRHDGRETPWKDRLKVAETLEYAKVNMLILQVD